LTSFRSKQRGIKRRARRSYEYGHTRKRTHTHSLTHKNTQSHTFSLCLMHAHQNIQSQFSLSLSCLHTRWRSRWRSPSLRSFQKSICRDTKECAHKLRKTSTPRCLDRPSYINSPAPAAGSQPRAKSLTSRNKE